MITLALYLVKGEKENWRRKREVYEEPERLNQSLTCSSNRTPVNVATTAKPIVSYESLFGQFTSPCTPRVSITDRPGYRFLLILKNGPETFRKLQWKVWTRVRESLILRRESTFRKNTPELSRSKFSKGRSIWLGYSIISQSAVFFYELANDEQKLSAFRTFEHFCTLFSVSSFQKFSNP